ncbi:hypothetical protein RSK20926_06292 [Roseobacter sp. SK209-2-6]|nr:hypothetical protein RSK20926_06292 [Roseobacter sp. SK209-2-6]
MLQSKKTEDSRNRWAIFGLFQS